MVPPVAVIRRHRHAVFPSSSVRLTGQEVFAPLKVRNLRLVIINVAALRSQVVNAKPHGPVPRMEEGLDVVRECLLLPAVTGHCQAAAAFQALPGCTGIVLVVVVDEVALVSYPATFLATFGRQKTDVLLSNIRTDILQMSHLSNSQSPCIPRITGKNRGKVIMSYTNMDRRCSSQAGARLLTKVGSVELLILPIVEIHFFVQSTVLHHYSSVLNSLLICSFIPFFLVCVSMFRSQFEVTHPLVLQPLRLLLCRCHCK